MGELVVSADAEDLLCAYLRAALLAQGFPAKVATKVVAGESVTVFQTGGAGRQTKRTTRKQLTVDCRATKETRAGELARMTEALLFAAQGSMLGGFQVYSVESFAEPANLPDPGNPTYSRYRQTVEIHMESTVLAV